MNSLLAHMLLNYITGTTNYTESYYLLTNSEAYIVVLKYGSDKFDLLFRTLNMLMYVNALFSTVL